MTTSRISSVRHLVASVACSGALSALAGCAAHAGGAAAAGQAQPLPVTAQAVRVGSITSTFSLTGTVVPARQADLASVASGTIRSVDVQIGDRVTAGELLVQIDDSTLRAELAQDEAALTEARARLDQTSATNAGTAQTTDAALESAQVAAQAQSANLQRDEQLFKQGYISQASLDQARSQSASAQSDLRGAQIAAQSADMSTSRTSAARSDVASMAAAVVQDAAAVQMVQTQIAQAAVTAPFDGIVTQRNVDPGSLASPGTQLVQVSQLDPAFVDVGIPDDDLQFVRAGSGAVISIDALPGQSWRGAVENLNAAAGQGTLTYLARIGLPNPDIRLKAGMVANVTFVAARHRGALIVPRGAVLSTDNGSAVYVVVGGKAKIKQVSVVLETQTEAQISGAGIGPGTEVITERPDALSDDSPVKVVSVN
jgi:HlyD family secretion protein